MATVSIENTLIASVLAMYINSLEARLKLLDFRFEWDTVETQDMQFSGTKLIPKHVFGVNFAISLLFHQATQSWELSHFNLTLRQVNPAEKIRVTNYLSAVEALAFHGVHLFKPNSLGLKCGADLQRLLDLYDLAAKAMGYEQLFQIKEAV